MIWEENISKQSKEITHFTYNQHQRKMQTTWTIHIGSNLSSKKHQTYTIDLKYFLIIVKNIYFSKNKIMEKEYIDIYQQENTYLWILQDIHKNTNELLIHGLFDQKPNIRQYTAKEYKVSLPDLAEIPNKVSDEKIIKLIASEMNKNLEKKMDPIDRNNYENDYLISYKNKDWSEQIKLIQTAIKYFNKVLNYKIEAYKTATGKTIPMQYIQLHPHNPHGKIELTWTDQIIQFFRKEFIQKAYEKWEITEQERIAFVKYSCDLLKKMYAYEDERQNHETLEWFRKVFNSYTTNELTKDFYHKAKHEWTPMITDKSDKYYFSDKRYRVSEEALKKHTIALPTTKDIYFEIEVRAKDSLSIQRKEIFDPNMDSALAASDIGGIRSIGDNNDDLNILLAYHLMKYNTNTMEYNKELYNEFANGNKQEQKTWKPYTQEEIAIITKKYLPKVKDKDVLKVITVREQNESQPAQYALDEEFFEKHNIQDPFVLQQLKNAVEEKNKAMEIEFQEIKKDKDESKKETLKNVIKHTHPEFQEYCEKDKDMELLYRVIKKISSLEKKKENLLLMQEIEQQADIWLIHITNKTQTSLSYKRKQWEKKVKTIVVQPSEFTIQDEKKKAFYIRENDTCVIKIDDKTIAIEEVIRLSKTFKHERKAKEIDMRKKRQKAGRKIWSADRKEVKLLGKLYTNMGKYFSGEHQFVTRWVLNNMKPTTIAEVYDNIKAVFEEARCFNILTEKDVIDIINNRMIPMLEYTAETQNGMSWKEILEVLKKWSTKKKEQEAIAETIFNELTERWLRNLTINGTEIEWLYVKAEYVSRLKRNSLRID
jgi:hypothetical protein